MSPYLFGIAPHYWGTSARGFSLAHHPPAPIFTAKLKLELQKPIISLIALPINFNKTLKET
jgi:hypothetical protein